jgi:UDP:flavonoid glycosyltransferase YjiC (YdhE family)
MAEVFLLTRGTGGDVYPFIRIGRELKSRRHEVVLFAFAKFRAVIKGAGLDFYPLDPFTPYREWLAGRGLANDLDAQGQYMVLDLVDVCERVAARRRSAQTVLVANTNIYTTALLASEKAGAAYLPVHMAPFFAAAIGQIMKLHAGGARYLDAACAALGQPPVGDWEAYLTTRRAALGIWPEWFAPPRDDWMLDVKPVGFLRSEEVERGELPEGLRELLDGGGPTVLITHGSSKPDGTAFFDAGVEACRRLGLSCVVVDPHTDPAGVPPRPGLRRYKFVPFAALMPHLAALIHHGGTGTLGLAITYGVPQVVLACGFDRPDNAARLAGLGVAEYLPPYRWRASEVAEALGRVLAAPVGLRCRALARQAGQHDASRAACELIESLVPGHRPGRVAAR